MILQTCRVYWLRGFNSCLSNMLFQCIQYSTDVWKHDRSAALAVNQRDGSGFLTLDPIFCSVLLTCPLPHCGAAASGTKTVQDQSGKLGSADGIWITSHFSNFTVLFGWIVWGEQRTQQRNSKHHSLRCKMIPQENQNTVTSKYTAECTTPLCTAASS